LDIDGAALGTVVGTINASAMTAAFKVQLSTSAVSGVSVTTGTGADEILGSQLNDTIAVGRGADTIESKGGTDTIDLTETVVAADTLKYAHSGALNVDTVTSFDVGTTDDIVSVSIGNIVDNGGGNDTLSTMGGTDINATLAAAAFTAEAVATNTNLTAADATNLLVFTNLSATSFATAIGSASITATTGTNTGGLSATEGVLAVWYDSAKSQAVYGYIEDTAATGTALTSADTFHEIVRVGMTSANFTLANIDASLSAY
jgi:hypothetical protein